MKKGELRLKISLADWKWIGTGLCLIGVALTSFNIYPANILFGFVGSGIWALVGFVKDDGALFVVEIVAVGLYAAGLITYVGVQLSYLGLG